jgi:glucokinase
MNAGGAIHAVGIDLGGSSIKAVRVTPAGETLDRLTLAFDAQEPRAWAEEIRRLVRDLSARSVANGTNSGPPEPELDQVVGLSAPGLAANDGRRIASMPGRLQGLEGLDWTTFIAARRPVPVLNDAQAALLGETWIGAARGLKNAFLLTLGTGVGGAAIVDGHLLRGEIGRAGHLGHLCLDIDGVPDVCGTPGSLEDAVGNCTIERRGEGRFATTHDLVAAYERGDPAAKAVWTRSIRALACGIASLINILDPAVVILGGGIARSGAPLFEPLERELGRVEWRPGGHRVRIVPAQLGEYAGAYGAARWALDAERAPASS